MYLIDSDVLITAATRNYSFEVFPGLWIWLDRLLQTGQLGSEDMVLAEIRRVGSDLSGWALERRSAFLVPDSNSPPHLTRVADWVQDTNRPYRAHAVAEFLQVADHQLVALALQHGATVLTQESSAQASERRVKIPDVCSALGVECIDFPALLNRLRPTFVLQ